MIQEYVEERKIEYLFHFTRKENLASILKNGLRLREEALERFDAIVNDEVRLDRTEAVCLSISFPNYKMFYGLRQANSEAEWVVLVLSSRILWELDCVFCIENAASNSVRFLPLHERKGAPALRAMFDDFGGVKRSDQGIADHVPSNPQAEVLVLEGIPSDYFLYVLTESKKLESELKSQFSDFKTQYYPKVFLPRKDHGFWKKEQ